MMSCTYGCLRNVINLGNSIIGVSILAMPYCFQKCGILLSLLLIILSGILVRTACYLLLKGAIMARRRNFEFLAFHALGSSGKLAVEIGIIGFLIGVCIAFFVVIGDLGPTLASQYFAITNNSNLRAEVLIFLGAFIVLPLGLLRKVDSLTSLSFLSIGFYVCLVLKIFAEASSKLSTNDWIYEVNWWNLDGILPCLPIFSMALSCQTQLFEFFDTLSEPSVKRMTSVVSGAVCLCSTVYISVGVFGYIACHNQTITGNILVNLTPSILTEFIKLGFIVTVVISFPLCLFPCRTSLHSLLFKQGLGHHDIAANFIPDYRFRALTISLVAITVGVAIMLPNIEFVLSIIGSTIGTIICFIFPAVIFIQDSDKNMIEKRIAQAVLFVGVFILFACTYSTLREGSQSRSNHPLSKDSPILAQQPVIHHLSADLTHSSPPPPSSSYNDLSNLHIKKPEKKKKIEVIEDQNEKRQEPPQPQEDYLKQRLGKKDGSADIDPQALQKEDKEIQKESHNDVTPAKAFDSVALKDKQEQLLRQLQEQQKEQQIILQQQKQVLEELKMHKEIHESAVKEEVKKIPDAEKQINLQKNIHNISLGFHNSVHHERNVINILPTQNSQVKPIEITSSFFPKKPIESNIKSKESEHLTNLKLQNINLEPKNKPKLEEDAKPENIFVDSHLIVPQIPILNKGNDKSILKNRSFMNVKVSNSVRENNVEFKSLNDVQSVAVNVHPLTKSIPSQNTVNRNLAIKVDEKIQQKPLLQSTDNQSVINKINVEPLRLDNKKPEMR